MKASPTKRSPWVYLGLFLMIGALLIFSISPLVSSILQQSRVDNAAATPLDANTRRLEAEALGYELVLEREPDNINALQGLLENRLRQSNLKDAIAPLERLSQLIPEQIEYTLLLAQTKQQLQDYEGASNLYRNLLASNPLDIRTLKGLSDLFMLQKRDAEAIQTVQNAITQAIKIRGADPSEENSANVTSVQLLLGEIYLQQNRVEEAIALYDNISQMSPDDFRPVLAKDIVLNKQGKPQAAEPLFQQALLLAPTQYKETIKQMSLNS